jgi:hypothetical protein
MEEDAGRRIESITGMEVRSPVEELEGDEETRSGSPSVLPTLKPFWILQHQEITGRSSRESALAPTSRADAMATRPFTLRG